MAEIGRLQNQLHRHFFWSIAGFVELSVRVMEILYILVNLV